MAANLASSFNLAPPTAANPNRTADTSGAGQNRPAAENQAAQRSAPETQNRSQTPGSDAPATAPQTEAVVPDREALAKGATPRSLNAQALRTNAESAGPPAITEVNSPENLQRLRDAGVPESAINHLAGAPVAPSNNQFRDVDFENPQTRDRLKEGVLFNETSFRGHRYATRTRLPDNLTPEQLQQLVYGFNAPTRGALDGIPNNPNERRGTVDASVGAHVIGAPGLRERLGIRGLWGGDVDLHRGTTPEGLPYAVNSTIENSILSRGGRSGEGAHPLLGHITRSIEVHNGRYYLRTDGVGQTPQRPVWHDHRLDPRDALRHQLNAFVGPETFLTLDRAALNYARQNFPNAQF